MDHWTSEGLAGREDAAPACALRRGPTASGVTGRSARWHDPDVLAELRMHELAEEHRGITVPHAGAGVGCPVALLMGIWGGVHGRRRLPRR